MVVFPTIEDGSEAVSAIIAAGIVPAALEMMDGKVCRAVEEAVHAGYPADAGSVLLIEVEGIDAGLDAVMQQIADVCIAHRASSIHQAASAAERARLWVGRKSALGAMGRIAPNYFLEDGVVPPQTARNHDLRRNRGAEIRPAHR
ncbi:MAG: FAD-linked oxidase C-terminal domain-containing protein [Caldilineaceae bacterium]